MFRRSTLPLCFVLLLVLVLVSLPACTTVKENGRVVFSTSSNMQGMSYRSAAGSTLTATAIDNSGVINSAGSGLAGGAMSIGAGFAASKVPGMLMR